jgi:hypothetical protein
MKLLKSINYLMKLNLLLIVLLFTYKSVAASSKSKYSLLDKPLDIAYSIGNKKMLMRTYMANKKQRMSSFRLRILRNIYDQQFAKYGIVLTQDEKNKVKRLWLKLSPQKKLYLKFIKSLSSTYEDVYKISLLMKKNKLTPNAAYNQYVKENKTKLSKERWEKLFNITSFEWRQKFAKANKHDQISLLIDEGMFLILQIRLLWEKMLIANKQDVAQAVKKWKAQIKALSITVPDEYLGAKNKAIKTLQSLFPPKHDILNAKTRPAYEELKKLVK